MKIDPVNVNNPYLRKSPTGRKTVTPSSGSLCRQLSIYRSKEDQNPDRYVGSWCHNDPYLRWIHLVFMTILLLFALRFDRRPFWSSSNCAPGVLARASTYVTEKEELILYSLAN